MPGGGQLGDLAEQLDVAQRVAAAAAAGAARRDQPDAVVLAQGLRVQAGQLGGHADHVDRDRRTGDPAAATLPTRVRPSRATLEQAGSRIGAARGPHGRP